MIVRLVEVERARELLAHRRRQVGAFVAQQHVDQVARHEIEQHEAHERRQQEDQQQADDAGGQVGHARSAITYEVARGRGGAPGSHPPPCGEGRRGSRSCAMRAGVGEPHGRRVLSPASPHPARLRQEAQTSDPPHKGEGEETAARQETISCTTRAEMCKSDSRKRGEVEAGASPVPPSHMRLSWSCGRHSVHPDHPGADRVQLLGAGVSEQNRSPDMDAVIAFADRRLEGEQHPALQHRVGSVRRDVLQFRE